MALSEPELKKINRSLCLLINEIKLLYISRSSTFEKSGGTETGL